MIPTSYPSEPVVSIIIVSYNNASVLCQTLDSLFRELDTPSIEIIVVDNASSENNVDRILKQYRSVNVLTLPSNVGFGQACNHGSKEARGKYLLFVNSDILLYSNPLPAMLQLMESRDQIGVVGVQLLNEDFSPQPCYFRFPSLSLRAAQLSGLKYLMLCALPRLRFSKGEDFRVDFISGAFFLIAKSLFVQLGGFDPEYFMYLEDADLCYRAARIGKHVVVCNKGNVVHLGKHYETSKHPFVFYQMNRGLLLFYRKHYPTWKYLMFVLMNRAYLFPQHMFASVIGMDDDYRAEMNKCRELYRQCFAAILKRKHPALIVQ